MPDLTIRTTELQKKKNTETQVILKRFKRVWSELREFEKQEEKRKTRAKQTEGCDRLERRTTEEDRERERENRNDRCGRGRRRARGARAGVTGKRGRRAARWQRRRRRTAEDVPVSRRPGRCTRHQSPPEAVASATAARTPRPSFDFAIARASGIRNSAGKTESAEPRSGMRAKNNQETRFFLRGCTLSCSSGGNSRKSVFPVILYFTI